MLSGIKEHKLWISPGPGLAGLDMERAQGPGEAVLSVPDPGRAGEGAASPPVTAAHRGASGSIPGEGRSGAHPSLVRTVVHLQNDCLCPFVWASCHLRGLAHTFQVSMMQVWLAPRVSTTWTLCPGMELEDWAQRRAGGRHLAQRSGWHLQDA